MLHRNQEFGEDVIIFSTVRNNEDGLSYRLFVRIVNYNGTCKLEIH